MTADGFRKLALSFPEAHEEPHMARTSFRVGKKIFATMNEDETEGVITKVEPRERLYRLAEEKPRQFFTMGGWSRMGALGIKLAHADEALVRELLEASWRRIAPKRALAAFSGGARRKP